MRKIEIVVVVRGCKKNRAAGLTAQHCEVGLTLRHRRCHRYQSLYSWILCSCIGIGEVG